MARKHSNSVQFHYLESGFYFPSRTLVKSFLLKLFKKEGAEVEEVHYFFCSDRYLHEINKTHLNHDTYTDIITFQYNQPSMPVLSDIYISIDRVRENAQIFQTSFTKELHRVLFHGALHLCGYKDKTKKDAALMRSMENYYLEQMFHVK